MKVRYYGHMGGRGGFARAANDYALALHRAGVELELRPLDRDPVFEGSFAELADLNRSITPDLVLVHTLPLDCPRVVELEIHAGNLEPRVPALAYTTWEARTAPNDLIQRLLGVFHKVMAPSDAAVNALLYNCTESVAWGVTSAVPHAVDESSLASRKGNGYSASNPGRPFTFYYVGAWNNRKNPHGVLRAFAHAFAPGQAELILHCPDGNPHAIAREVASLGLEVSQMPKVWISTKHLTDDQIVDLHANKADCFVSASRGEAWNLPAFEAMCAGRPVLAPMGLGSDQYLKGWRGWIPYIGIPTVATNDMQDAEVAFDGQRAAVTRMRGAQGLTAKMVWLEPDMIGLSHIMRRAVELYRGGVYIEPHHDLAATYGYSAVAKRLIDLFQEVL